MNSNIIFVDFSRSWKIDIRRGFGRSSLGCWSILFNTTPFMWSDYIIYHISRRADSEYQFFVFISCCLIMLQRQFRSQYSARRTIFSTDSLHLPEESASHPSLLCRDDVGKQVCSNIIFVNFSRSWKFDIRRGFGRSSLGCWSILFNTTFFMWWNYIIYHLPICAYSKSAIVFLTPRRLIVFQSKFRSQYGSGLQIRKIRQVRVLGISK